MDRFQADYARGLALLKSGELDAANDALRKALALQPAHAGALHALGALRLKQSCADEAVDLIKASLRVQPESASALANLGIALKRLGKTDEALKAYERALSLEPHLPEAHYNRGIALHQLSRYEQAIAAYDRAIALDPLHALAYNNRGAALTDLNDLTRALVSYQKAHELSPDDAQTLWNIGLCLLKAGRYRDGWPLYEYGWVSGNRGIQRRLPTSLWLGDASIQNKTLLVYSEQGFGDTIQFCRLAQGAHQLGARVVLQVPSPLVRLLAHLDGVERVISAEDPVPEHDYHCPIMSLPLALRIDRETIPRATPYLSARGEKIQQWAQRLGHKDRPRVGLAWSGNPAMKNDHNRSIPLRDLLNALPSGADYMVLQKDLRDGDQEALRSRSDIFCLNEEIKDFEDTAALCQLADQVVSVCTSVAHLSGALSKPTAILLSLSGDWRWLVGTSQSPWYPSVRLLRQQQAQDWTTPLRELRAWLQTPNSA